MACPYYHSGPVSAKAAQLLPCPRPPPDDMDEIGYLTREDRAAKLALYARRGMCNRGWEYAYAPAVGTVKRVDLHVRPGVQLFDGATVALPDQNDGAWTVRLHRGRYTHPRCS